MKIRSRNKLKSQVRDETIPHQDNLARSRYENTEVSSSNAIQVQIKDHQIENTDAYIIEEQKQEEYRPWPVVRKYPVTKATQYKDI